LKRPSWLAGILGCVLAQAPGGAGADAIEPGVWILEIRRSDAPPDIKKLRIEVEAGEYAAALESSSSEPEPLPAFRVDAESVSFDFSAAKLSCALAPEEEHAGQWVGTCPPGEEPGSDDVVTVRLRPPEGKAPD